MSDAFRMWCRSRKIREIDEDAYGWRDLENDDFYREPKYLIVFNRGIDVRPYVSNFPREFADVMCAFFGECNGLRAFTDRFSVMGFASVYYYSSLYGGYHQPVSFPDFQDSRTPHFTPPDVLTIASSYSHKRAGETERFYDTIDVDRKILFRRFAESGTIIETYTSWASWVTARLDFAFSDFEFDSKYKSGTRN